MSYDPRISFRVHANTFGKRDPKDRDCREPTGQLEHAVRNGEMVTCLVQIVNEPVDVTLLEVLHTSFILLAVKCVVETIGELGRRPVEG